MFLKESNSIDFAHKIDRLRILSLKETCRLQAKAIFPVLVDCVKSYFNNTLPDLSWI